MTQGKSKKQYKKGGRKKQVNPFTKKEWYHLRAPAPFENKQYGWTTVTKTTGTSKRLSSLLLLARPSSKWEASGLRSHRF